MALAGYQVTVLCADRSPWCNRFDESLLSAVHGSVQVTRVATTFFTRGPRILQRLEVWLQRYYPSQHFPWLVKASIVGTYLTLIRRPHCIITSGPPHICHIVGWIAAKVTRRRWIVDYRDLWTDDPIHCPAVGRRFALFEAIERRIMKDASAVMTVSPSWQRHLAEKFSADKGRERFVLIRNGFNPEDAAPAPPRPTGDKLRVHIHFNGTPQPLAATSALFEGLCRLRATAGIPAERFPLVTFTGLTEAERAEIKSLQLEDCVLDVGHLPKQRSIEYSCECNALLVTVNNSNWSRQGTIPAKTYEAMALGRHILAIVPPCSDVTDLLAEYGNATVCNVESPDDICRGLLSLSLAHAQGDLSRFAPPDSEHLRRMLLNYSREVQARSLMSLIESLAASH
jgi:hypothetical protein